MKKLKFRTFEFDSSQVLTRAQLKRVMGGFESTTAAKCGTCKAKTADGHDHTVDCYGTPGDCPCPDGLQCGSGGV
jgi:hypothetical protein